MPLPDALQAWMDAACTQIRWKRARPVAARELAAHLEEQQEVFLAAGMDEATAAAHTTEEMGDAVAIGTALDRVWRPKPDWFLLIWVLVVVAVGLAMQCAVSHGIGAADQINPMGMLLKFIAGAFCLCIGYLADFTWLGKHPWMVHVAWLAVFFVALFTGGRVNGRIYAIVYIAWLAILPCVASIYGMRQFGAVGVLGVFSAMLCVLFLLMLAPAFTEGLMLAFVALVLMLIAVRRKAFGENRRKAMLFALLPSITMTGLLVLYIRRIPYLIQRFLIMLNPSKDPEGMGYMAMQIQTLWAGGDSPFLTSESMKTQFLLTWVKNQWGWAGFLLLAALLFVLLTRLFVQGRRQGSLLGKLTIYAVAMVFTMRAITYLLANVGIMFYGGAGGLPFLSYGGTALCADMLLLGFALSAVRTGKLHTDKILHRKPALTIHTKHVHFDRGTLTIRFKP